MQFWVPRLAVLTAVLCLAASAPDPAENDTQPEQVQPVSWMMENTISIVMFTAVAIGLGVWFFVTVRRRMELYRADEQKAASMLEAEMLALLNARQAASSPPTVLPAPPESPATGRETPPAEKLTQPPGAEALEGLLNKLRAGGLFGAVEGALFLSDGRSEGKIVRLSDGRMALVLGQMEPPEFLARHLKRFDVCIVALGADQAYVISPLGAMIASRFSL
ncbi:MAG: hypothetical protein N3D11_17110 [Candidatus Sumerlaeia bacterium]|nr:hypothetical protein [Candidatus Sumerlaeia bacterium]